MGGFGEGNSIDFYRSSRKIILLSSPFLPLTESSLPILFIDGEHLVDKFVGTSRFV